MLPGSLRARLPVLVALVVAAVLMTSTYLEVRSFEGAVERELVETASRTARAVLDDLALRGPDFDAADLRDTLNELIEANSALLSVTILELDPTDVRVLASTSSEEREESVELAREAISARQERVHQRAERVIAALPFVRDGHTKAVVTSVSLASVQQVRTRGRMIALWFAVPTILLVTVLIDVVLDRLVHRPIAELQGTIRRVSGGDLASRAAILRRDELGTVASGLNEMLGRLEHASEALQQRVREATSELLVRNAELEESYQRMLGMREELASAERMAALGQMAASVAHQVGTPLNLVSGYVQMIREDRNTDAGVRQRLEIVEAQLTQVTRVLRTMLDQVRKPVPRARISLKQLVERACALARPRLVRSGVRLDVSVADSLPDVQADAAQLELGLLNLITNAVDAMPEGGVLRITGTATAHGAVLEIADSGSGIPADLLPDLFEPWVTTKPIGHGTGLGLGIVREVVRAHGGDIRVCNDPGGGAVFTIELPGAAEASRADLGAAPRG